MPPSHRPPTRAGGRRPLALSAPERRVLYLLWQRNNDRPDRRGLKLTNLPIEPTEAIRLVARLEEGGYVYWDQLWRWDLRITSAGALAIGERLW